MAPKIKFIITKLLAILLLLASFSVALSSYYYLSHLRPTLCQMRGILEHLTTEERALPPALTQMANLSHGNASAIMVAKALVQGEQQSPACPNRLGWHVCLRLLGDAMDWSFSRTELMQLWSKFAYLGYPNVGFQAAARERFSKPLKALTTEEMAELVLIAKSPSSFKDNPERLAKSKQRLLARLATSS